MPNLDSLDEIKKLDSKNIYGSVIKLADQVEQVWKDMNKKDLPKACYTSKSVVVAGMGGSALGGRVIDSLVSEKSRAPIEIFTEYHLPKYVNKDTLVILSSYSGNTEETLADTNEALSRNAQIIGITTGGKLAEIIKKESLNHYIYDPVNNPSGQPRMAIGYSVTAIMAILSKCGFVSVSDDDVIRVISLIRKLTKELSIETKENDNLAKKMARMLKDKIPVLVASEHLVGSAHVFKNQLNESAKTFSTLFDIPELNHHLMEGLRFPAKAKELLWLLFIESDLYTESVVKRYPITEAVVEKNSVGFSKFALRSTTKIEQIFELITFGSFVQFYLAMLNGVDPYPIPWVDYFKREISK